MARRIVVVAIVAACGRVGFDGVAGDAGGDGSSIVDAVTPRCEVRLGAGREHICAVAPADGRLWCWGLNNFGQLGIDPQLTTHEPEPFALAIPADVVDVAGGRYQTCVARAGGGVTCWGEGADMQTGRADRVSSHLPTDVMAIGDALRVEASSIHACALRAGGQVWCWGNGDNGRLGHGSNTSSATPVRTMGIDGASELSSGGSTSCAVQNGSELWCWGENASGQHGNGTTTLTTIPVRNLTPAARSSAFRDETGCAVVTDGRVSCWGRGNQGQLGNGSRTSSSTPVAVQGITTAREVAVGIEHACAVLTDGTVVCWGDNALDQLARAGGDANDSATPVVIPGLVDKVHVVASGFTTCAVSSDGEVDCWGSNVEGTLGDGTLTPRAATIVRAIDLCP